jgi:hypothetical protein
VSFHARTCYVVRWDSCGAALGGDWEVHVPTADPATSELVEEAEESDWTTDGERWHCEDCPPLRPSVCRPCRRGFHSLCQDPDCTCARKAPTAGQGVLPGIEQCPVQEQWHARTATTTCRSGRHTWADPDDAARCCNGWRRQLVIAGPGEALPTDAESIGTTPGALFGFVWVPASDTHTETR